MSLVGELNPEPKVQTFSLFPVLLGAVWVWIQRDFSVKSEGLTRLLHLGTLLLSLPQSTMCWGSPGSLSGALPLGTPILMAEQTGEENVRNARWAHVSGE